MKLLIVALVTVIWGLFIRWNLGSEYFITDVNGIGWFQGVVGTVYTLFAAFIIVEVWGQYSTVSNLVAKEAKTIATIWNLANYLDDSKLDERLKVVLIKYCGVVIKNESVEAASMIRSIHPSKELTEIHLVLDGVEFNDKRDMAVFPLLVQAFEELSNVRSERIEAGVTRLPGLLKKFFAFLSILLLVSFSFIGFVSIYLYLFTLVTGGVVVAFAFFIASDLDNPFDGVWNVGFEAIEQAQKYVENFGHRSGVR